MRLRSLLVAAAAGSALLTGLAACGSSGNSTVSGGKTPTSTGAAATVDFASLAKDPKAAALVPAGSTTITVGSDVADTLLPYVGNPGTTGLQADIRTGLEKVLGVTFNVENSTFEQVVPGVQSGKYQVGMSNFGVTKARLQILDFVTYLNDGQSLVESSSNNLTPITSAAQVTELCGKTVVTGPGTTFQTLITQSQAACTSAGKPQIKLNLITSLAESIQELTLGKADVYFGPTAGARYISAHTPGIKFLNQYSTTPVGFVLTKGNPLEKALQAGMNDLIGDGAYRKILAKYSVPTLGVTTSQINPPATF